MLLSNRTGTACPGCIEVFAARGYWLSHAIGRITQAGTLQGQSSGLQMIRPIREDLLPVITSSVDSGMMVTASRQVFGFLPESVFTLVPEIAFTLPWNTQNRRTMTISQMWQWPCELKAFGMLFLKLPR